MSPMSKIETKKITLKINIILNHWNKIYFADLKLKTNRVQKNILRNKTLFFQKEVSKSSHLRRHKNNDSNNSYCNTHNNHNNFKWQGCPRQKPYHVTTATSNRHSHHRSHHHNHWCQPNPHHQRFPKIVRECFSVFRAEIPISVGLRTIVMVVNSSPTPTLSGGKFIMIGPYQFYVIFLIQNILFFILCIRTPHLSGDDMTDNAIAVLSRNLPGDPHN